MMKLDRVLSTLSDVRTDEVVIATMTAGFVWPGYSRSDRDFCYVAPMGSAAPIGLGLALARPDLRVWVLDGEGSLLMNLGALVTIGAQRPPNLVHLVLDNGVYAITGGQPMPGTASADLVAIARGAGIANAQRIDGDAGWDEFLEGGLRAPGPVFVDARVEAAYDRNAAAQLTHAPRALSSQGGPGFHNLRALLND